MAEEISKNEAQFLIDMKARFTSDQQPMNPVEQAFYDRAEKLFKGEGEASKQELRAVLEDEKDFQTDQANTYYERNQEKSRSIPTDISLFPPDKQADYQQWQAEAKESYRLFEETSLGLLQVVEVNKEGNDTVFQPFMEELIAKANLPKTDIKYTPTPEQDAPHHGNPAGQGKSDERGR